MPEEIGPELGLELGEESMNNISKQGGTKMTNDDDAVIRGMVRVALYHRLPKNDWMAKVVPGVEKHLGAPLSEEVVDQIHEAFGEEMPPEMAIAEICFPDNRPLVEVLAENLSIYANDPSGDYLSQAKEMLEQFRAARGREPTEYMEIEEFFHAGKGGCRPRDV